MKANLLHQRNEQFEVIEGTRGGTLVVAPANIEDKAPIVRQEPENFCRKRQEPADVILFCRVPVLFLEVQRIWGGSDHGVDRGRRECLEKFQRICYIGITQLRTVVRSEAREDQLGGVSGIKMQRSLSVYWVLRDSQVPTPVRVPAGYTAMSNHLRAIAYCTKV